MNLIISIFVVIVEVNMHTNFPARKRDSNALISKFFKVRRRGEGGGDLYPNCFSEWSVQLKKQRWGPLRLDFYDQF